MKKEYFKPLHVPETWKHYWSKYPEGYTILESLMSWVSQVDNMSKQLNDNTISISDFVDYITNELDTFLEQFGPNLKDEVKKTLEEWQDSGFLEIIIGEALQTQIDYVESETNKKIRVYRYYSDLDLDPKTATPKEIVDAMDDYSMAILQVGQHNTGFYNNPYDYGTLVVEKANNTRANLQFIWLTENRRAYAIRRKDDNNDFISDWEEVGALKVNDQPLNSDRSISELLEVAQTYVKTDYWTYGHNTPLRSNSFIVDGKRVNDCSTFVIMTLLGIRFEDSKYYSQFFSNRVRDDYRWAFDIDNAGLFYSYRMAEQFYHNGWEIKPFSDFSNLQKGDLIFYKRMDPGREHSVGFRNIDHVGFYYGKESGEHKILEIWVGGEGVRLANMLGARADRLAMVARVPLNDRMKRSEGSTPRFFACGKPPTIHSIRGLSSTNLTIHSTTLNLADYNQIEVGTINTVGGEEVESDKRIRTGFIPCPEQWGAYSSNSPKDYNLLFIAYYDRHKNFLGLSGDNPNRFYMRRVYSYNSEWDITPTILKLFRDNFMINTGGVARRWVKGVSKEINIALDSPNSDLVFDGLTYSNLSDGKSATLLNGIKQLKSAGLTHIYTNQLNDLVIEY